MNIIKIKQKNKGFTLIEMLVVITIIGILAGMILVVLGTARGKAKDARIIQEMAQIRNAAAMYYNSHNYSYDLFGCGDTESKMDLICADMGGQGGIKPSDETTPDYGVDVFADDLAFCAAVKLNLGAYWCVDSKGRSARYNTSPACANGNHACE